MTRKNRFCPNCGSEDVEPDFSDAGYVGGAGGNPNAWECNNCGFTGLMPEQGSSPEGSENSGEKDSEEESGMEFEPGDDYRRFATNFGRGELKFYLYVMIPAALIYIVYLVLVN
jgi:ribosomal protein S27AE